MVQGVRLICGVHCPLEKWKVKWSMQVKVMNHMHVLLILILHFGPLFLFLFVTAMQIVLGNVMRNDFLKNDTLNI